MKSSRRILTAALNPSNAEFPDQVQRFNIARGLEGPVGLEAELGAYFEGNPYERWFRSFEPVLNGLDASYGGTIARGKFSRTALHLDMCSPIATSPTWSELKPDQRLQLTGAGRRVFEWLVEALVPDIIIASVSWRHIEGWHDNFRDGREWDSTMSYTTTFNGKNLVRPLQVRARILRAGNGFKYLFVNGDAANMPFGHFHNNRKFEVGRELQKLIESFM